MEARYASGQPVFHPEDTKDDFNKAIKGVVARNGVIGKTGQAVDIREKSDQCKGLHQPKKFSSLLAIFRKRAGLSLTALATVSGVSRRAIVAIEQGDVEPTLTTTKQLLSALGLSLSIGDESVA